MKKFDAFNNQLKLLVNDALSRRGGTIQISTPDAKLIIHMENDHIVSMVYEQGSMKKAWNHTLSSGKELMSASREVLLFLVSKLRLIFNWRHLLRRKQLRIKYIPKLEDGSKP